MKHAPVWRLPVSQSEDSTKWPSGENYSGSRSAPRLATCRASPSQICPSSRHLRMRTACSIRSRTLTPRLLPSVTDKDRHSVDKWHVTKLIFSVDRWRRRRRIISHLWRHSRDGGWLRPLQHLLTPPPPLQVHHLLLSRIPSHIVVTARVLPAPLCNHFLLFLPR